MLNAGADPQIRGDYGDCINVAVSSNQTEMIDLLTSTSSILDVMLTLSGVFPFPCYYYF